jgi:hypothetical protein
MRRAGWLVVVWCLVGPASASAGQEPPPAPPATGEEPPVDAGPAPSAPAPPAIPVDVSPPVDPVPQPETEIAIDEGTRVAAGIAFDQPIGAAASVEIFHGLAADVRESEARVKAVCAVPIPRCAQGFLVQVGAGSGGGEVSLGLGARAHVNEEDFRGTVGVGLRAALAHTWGSPVGTEPGLTYLGPQLDLSVLRVDLTLGVLWRVSGHRGAFTLFSWGVGFGM